MVVPSPITGTDVLESPLGNKGAFSDYTDFVMDGVDSAWTDTVTGNTIPQVGDPASMYYAGVRDFYRSYGFVD
tara:strand:+ start:4330 stop:4548 length:219 start_codon:yes stop_codon:yes gene_type:complete